MVQVVTSSKPERESNKLLRLGSGIIELQKLYKQQISVASHITKKKWAARRYHSREITGLVVYAACIYI